MKWQVVSLAQAQPQPWRNGGGVTRELLAWPTACDWQVRLSVAEVQAAGPFSRYDGLERWFAVLQGDGVVLRLGDAEHRLTTDSEPFRFDGAAAVHCTPVRGATRDFNVMARPGRATLRRVRGESGFGSSGRRLLALYCHGSEARVGGSLAELALAPYHLAWVLATGEVEGTVRGEDALWMEVLA